MDLLDHLTLEHREIEKLLVCLKEGITRLQSESDAEPINFDLLFSALHHKVELVHHGKEEEILFPFLDQRGLPNQGGPRCGYFMGLFLEKSHLERLNREMKAFQKQRPRENLRKEMKTLIEKGSALSIPLEEHQVGHACLALLQDEVKNAADESELKTPFFFQISRFYLELMRLHIEKEDTCLFVLSREKMSQKESKTLLEKAVDYEKEILKRYPAPDIQTLF